MATLFGGLLLGACSVFGIRGGTEEPPHVAVAQVGDVEIRRYDPRLTAETVVPGDAVDARSEGFRRLAGYIFGNNGGRAKIAMTAPVAQADAGSSAQPGKRIAMTAPVSQAPVPQASAASGSVIRFFLPAGLKDPPHPNDDRVRVVAVPAETMAVLRWSGIATDAAVASHRAALLAALRGTDWRAEGEPVTWFYDPPWTLPPLRRNETAVPVSGPEQPGGQAAR